MLFVEGRFPDAGGQTCSACSVPSASPSVCSAASWRRRLPNSRSNTRSASAVPLDELRRQVAILESDAQASGTTRDDAVDRLRTNPDQLVARRGEAARADIARLARLSAQQQALAAATSPLGRVVAMLRDPDLPVAQAAYRDFSPAIPTNADGLAAGLIGFFAAWGGWRVVSDVGQRAARRRPRRTVTAA